MNHQLKIVILWLLLIVCMILHFNYHVSEIFYGIDVRVPNATGKVPNSILVIRSLFHFLPLLYIVALLWFGSKKIRLANLVLSLLYTASHLMHLAGEIKKGEDISQIVLLVITLFISVTLAYTSWLWLKNEAHHH